MSRRHAAKRQTERVGEHRDLCQIDSVDVELERARRSPVRDGAAHLATEGVRPEIDANATQEKR